VSIGRYLLSVSQRGEVLGSVGATSAAPDADAQAEREADAAVPIELRIERPTGLASEGRVRIGDEGVLFLRPGQTSIGGPTQCLLDEYGEAEIVYEEREPGAAWVAAPLLRLHVLLHVRDDVRDLYERLVSDLEAIHVGLAEDVLSRTSHRRRSVRAQTSIVRPEQDIERLESLHERLASALVRIGSQPSGTLIRTAEMARYRAGDRVRPAAIGAALRDPGTVVAGTRVSSIGRIEVLRTRPTTDIPEHRHLRDGLLHLASLSDAVAAHCSRSSVLFERDRRRWGRAKDAENSVFERRYGPRLRALEAFRSRSIELAERFRELVALHPFLAAASPSRTALAPTPIFRNRRGYHEAYLALLDGSRLSGSLVDGDEIRVRFRRLSTLYEYWCFIRIVDLVRTLPEVGPPEPVATFRLVDDVYRPELDPGQSFRFPVVRGRGIGGFVRVTYEPDILPDGWRTAPETDVDRRHRGPLRPSRASLSDAPLRPDVAIEVVRRDGHGAILVLDAKSTPNFRREAFVDTTDYRTRVFDPETGVQPVRQVFLLHRDERSSPVTNLPGYLEERVGSPSSSILGAMPFLPDRIETARRVVARFVGLVLVERGTSSH
jgi:hypothetical protein